MLNPKQETLTAILLCSVLAVNALFAVLLGAHAIMRRRHSEQEASAGEIATAFSAFLLGRTEQDALFRTVDRTSPEVLWSALERFSDNISGHEWVQVSQAICSHPFVLAERTRIKRGPPTRRALAARRIGMVEARAHRGLLHEAMRAGPLIVRLSAVLALARARDSAALRWLMRSPAALDPLGRHLGVAILKRFGSRQAGLLRRSVRTDSAEQSLELCAIEVLGLWKDQRSRPVFEKLLHGTGLNARVASARALGRIAAPASLAPLCKAAEDTAWQVRAQVAAALGGLRSQTVVPVLAGLMLDPAWWVRRNAAYALAAHDEGGRACLYRIAQLGTDRFAREMAIEVMQAREWDRHSPGGLERVG